MPSTQPGRLNSDRIVQNSFQQFELPYMRRLKKECGQDIFPLLEYLHRKELAGSLQGEKHTAGATVSSLLMA